MKSGNIQKLEDRWNVFHLRNELQESSGGEICSVKKLWTFSL